MKDNIVFTLKQIEDIKNTKNAETKMIAEAILKLADELIDGTVDWNGFINGGRGNVTEILGFAYCYTGKEIYFTEAKRMMDELCAIEDWFPRNNHGGSFQGKSDLISCRRARNMAYGYVLFGDMFTDEEKAYYAENTFKKGINLVFEDWVLHGTRIHALDTMGHNWWTYLVANGALAALMMCDVYPEGKKLAKEGAECMKTWFEYKGNEVNCKPRNIDNGGFWEGIDYFNGAIYDYLVFADLYKNQFGEKPFDDESVLRSCADFLIDFIYPSSKGDIKPDFGDADMFKKVSAMVTLIKYGIESDEYIWFLKRGFVIDADSLHQVLIWDYVCEKEDKLPERMSRICENIGWAEFKDSFENDGTMLAIKCGDTWNHCHSDAGTFFLFRKGEAEIAEGGEPLNYGSPAYQSYYVQSQAHNVVLFENKGQDYRDNYKNHAHNKGRLVNFKDEDGFRYVMADISGPMSRYMRKHHRHFLWIDKAILIYDDIECYDNGECNYLIHEEKEKTSFRMLTPCEYTLKEGYRKRSTEPNCKYKSYNLMTDSEGHAKFVSMLCLDESIEPIYEENEKYIKVTYGETVFFINKTSDGKIMHNNCLINAEGYETDAVILVKNKEKLGAVNCSVVRRDGEVLLGQWARVNGWCR